MTDNQISQMNGVRLITEDDVPYTALAGASNMELSRGLTSAALTSLGGGFIRFPEAGQLAGWTLRYDEFVFVLAGEMTVHSGGTSVPVRAGQGCLLRNGTTVTYQGAPGTKALYILHPIEWETRDTPGS